MNSRQKSTRLRDQLEQTFLKNIQMGRWAKNAKIPTEEVLIREYQASRSTIRRALKRLEDNGLIKAVQGMGRKVIANAENMPKTIGLLFPTGDLSSGIGYNYLRTLHQAVDEAGYSLSITAGSQLQPSPPDLHKLNGLLLTAQHLPPSEIRSLADQIPLVVIGHEASAAGVPSFFVDYGAQTALATRFLLGRGHSRIAVTYGKKPYFYEAGLNMRKAYEWTLRLEGRDFSPGLIMPASLNREGGRALYRQIREMHPGVTALISYGPATPLGMEEEADALGRKLSEELEIVCLNHFEDAKLPGWVHYFDCPYERVAVDAFQELLRAMDGAPSADEAQHAYCGRLVADGMRGRP
ncbi:MAG TPA: GntR family transcriptional regulator [Terrimicrobiaceae bacterium]|nr:GntR family transcriptional regulator [Terrimicrobiaceae bacterium]